MLIFMTREKKYGMSENIEFNHAAFKHGITVVPCQQTKCLFRLLVKWYANGLPHQPQRNECPFEYTHCPLQD
jgi:hypothetical protein